MDTRCYMVIIKGEIKTSEIMSCVYNRNTQKWDVKFNNGKTYSYAYLNVEKLTDPEVLNPNMYRISRDGREFFDVNAIYVFISGSESYCVQAKDRREYKKITKKIAQLIKWKGKDTAKLVIKELKQTYPRRPALLDELEKVEKKL